MPTFCEPWPGKMNAINGVKPRRRRLRRPRSPTARFGSPPIASTAMRIMKLTNLRIYELTK